MYINYINNNAVIQLFRTATNLHLVKVVKYSCINLLWIYSSKKNYSDSVAMFFNMVINFDYSGINF